MLKFAIKIHGKHYQIENKERVFLFRYRSNWKQVCFYATRFIESDSANTAIEKAFEIVKAELQSVASHTENSNMSLYQIEENETAFDLYSPGQGFTFYVEEDIQITE